MACCFGQDYRQQRGGSRERFVALIEPAGPRSKLLSFTNLCGLHLLTSIQCRHRVPMAGVRKAIDYVKRSLGVERALTRIEYGDGGAPLVLFPYTRASAEAVASREQPRTVVIDPRRSFDRPVLAGAYVRTEVIEDSFRAGDSIADMARDYGVQPAAVEEALRFESRRAA